MFFFKHILKFSWYDFLCKILILVHLLIMFWTHVWRLWFEKHDHIEGGWLVGIASTELRLTWIGKNIGGVMHTGAVICCNVSFHHSRDILSLIGELFLTFTSIVLNLLISFIPTKRLPVKEDNAPN